MEALENVSTDINTWLSKFNKNQLISVLTQFNINTEGKPDVKQTHTNAIKKGYEDIMGNEERDLEQPWAGAWVAPKRPILNRVKRALLIKSILEAANRIFH